MCPAGGLFTLADNGEAPGQWPQLLLGTNISWSFAPIGNPIAVVLRDAGGDVVDFVSAGNCDPFLITSPRRIPATEWSGLPVVAIMTNATAGAQLHTTMPRRAMVQRYPHRQHPAPVPRAPQEARRTRPPRQAPPPGISNRHHR